ncbi:unnamed protein product [Rotaria sp. Silwood2]|nr:unnamed protein product [Rotaria sp. Silwood2]CAF4161926.1 unnamed protein product [Rotaria sp. Silwood2]
MGAYLSSPICDKDTIEGSNNNLLFSASSMQGWRMSQEDAHNAILNLDNNTSLFAVYDGHGGSEIAVYCSRYLPEFIKKLDSYKEGRLNDALIEGFLKFDSLLIDPNVKKILQKLANDEHEDVEQPHEFVGSLNPNEENHHNDELNIEEAQLLKKEAEVPIEEILKRYSGNEKHFHSPNVFKRIIDNHDENIHIIPINQHSDITTNSNQEIIQNNDNTTQTTNETKPSSSEEKTISRTLKKPNSIDSSTIIKSTSLTRHLLSDNTDELDDDDDDDDDEDDFEFNASDEETSGDEGEDHEIDDDEEEEDEDEDKPLEASKAAQIQKLMRKSIMAILNRRAKKKKRNATTNNDDDHQQDVKENHNEDHESDDNEEEEEEEEEEGDDDEEEDIDDTDIGMFDMDNDPGSSSGCTAVVALLRDKQLYVANAGDSRCVVCRNGRAIEMNHKPEDPKERSRIEKAGYKVTLDGRVSGGLNLSRAIGDHAYKKTSSLSAEEQAITALPDIRTLTLDDEDEFMIIACDGIWNFMSSQDVIDFVRLRLDKKTLNQICEELFMHCLAPNTCGDGTGCDNMTAIIVKFNFNSQSTTSQSSISLNNKRSLSPEHSSTTDIIDNSNSKKLKILTENSTNETKSTDILSLNSTEQTLS